MGRRRDQTSGPAAAVLFLEIPDVDRGRPSWTDRFQSRLVRSGIAAVSAISAVADGMSSARGVAAPVLVTTASAESSANGHILVIITIMLP